MEGIFMYGIVFLYFGITSIYINDNTKISNAFLECKGYCYIPSNSHTTARREINISTHFH